MIINLEAVEALLVFWTMVSEKEKVGDAYLHSMADMDVFKATFDDEFNRESFIKVLSAISNKEMLNGMNKKEGRFWNYNLWMLEDMEFTVSMVEPLKKLNLSGLEAPADTKLVFVPMNMQVSFKEGNNLYVNFFKIMANEWEETITIDGEDIKSYIQNML